MYWSIQVLTWVVLPFFQEYYNSGAFTARARIKDSIYINGVFYLIMFFIGVVFIIYMMIKKNMGVSMLNDFIKALANA